MANNNIRKDRTIPQIIITWIVLVSFYVLLLFVVDKIFGHFYTKIPNTNRGKIFIQYHLGKYEKKEIRSTPHPYLLYENAQKAKLKGVTQTNSAGYRNKEFSTTPPEGVTRILAMGGSTVYGSKVQISETWPAQLQKILADKLKSKIEVINAGLPDATSAEMVTHYMFRNRYLEAKIVIIHLGGNDSLPLLLDKYDPEYKYYRPGWSSTTLGIRPGERFLLRNSGIIRYLYAYWMKDSGLPMHYLVTKTVLDLDKESALKNAKERYPVGFERNLDLLIRNILADGAVPVLFKHLRASPAQFKIISQTSNLAKRREAFYEALWIARLKNLSVMDKLSKKYNIPIIEIDEDEMPVEYFADHTHMKVDGHAVKAQKAAEVLINILK